MIGVSIHAQNHIENIDICMNNNQYMKALQLIESQPQTKELSMKKITCYKALDNYGKATGLLEKLCENYPEDMQAKLELAKCYQALSNWEASNKCYDELIEADSSNVYYKIQKADMLFRLKEFSEALYFYKYLTENFKLQNMIKRSAQCYESMNMTDSAIVYYKKAWAIDSTDAFSAASLINQNLKLGGKHFFDAIDFSEEYIKKDSINKQINLLNALSYYGANRYDEAVERFEKCFMAGDSSLVVNRSLGISYYSLGMNMMAQPFLKRAYEQDSTNINVLYCLAVVSNEMNDYKKAVEYFKSLINRTVPSDMTLFLYYNGLATGFDGYRKDQDALHNYLVAEKYANKNQKLNLYYNIAVLYDYELNKPAEALNYYQKYRKSLEDYILRLKENINPDNPDKSEMVEIDIITNKMKSLNTHIERLKKKTDKTKAG